MNPEVAVPRSDVERLVDEFFHVLPGPLVADLRASLETEIGEEVEIVSVEVLSTTPPPWHLAANALRQLKTLVDNRGPAAVHELDQLRSTIRDELDTLKVTLYDEHAVYLGLVWSGLVTELARNGYANGHIDGDTYRAIGELIATIGAALLEYVPRGVLGE